MCRENYLFFFDKVNPLLVYANLEDNKYWNAVSHHSMATQDTSNNGSSTCSLRLRVKYARHEMQQTIIIQSYA